MDNTKFQYEGIKWIMERELLDHPQAVNTIKFNIMMTSSRIKEVELLIYRENKSMLVLLDLSWIGQKFFKKRIFEDVHDILIQLLPNFRFRVTDNPEIMNLAVAKVKKALTGGKYENDPNSSNVSSSVPNQQSISATTSSNSKEEENRVPEDSGSSEKEQSNTEQAIRPDSSENDSEEK